MSVAEVPQDLARIFEGVDYTMREMCFNDINRTTMNRDWREAKSIKMSKKFDFLRAILAGVVVGVRTYRSEDGLPVGAKVYLDAQHRGEAGKMAAFGDESFVAFEIEVGSPEEEANWILLLNEDRSPNTALDELRLGIKAGRPNVVGAVSLCSEYGFILDGSARPGHIGAIKRILHIYARPNGTEQLSRILECAAALAPGRNAIEGPVFTALDYFWRLHPDCKPRDAARWFARRGNANTYLASAKGRAGTPADNVYRELVLAWNKATRSQPLLPKK